MPTIYTLNRLHSAANPVHLLASRGNKAATLKALKMKYKTMQLNNGQFAVKARGRKYFNKTVGTKEYAEEQALIESMYYYQQALDEAQTQLNNMAIVAERTSIFGGIYLLQKDGVIEDKVTDINDLLA